MNISSEQVLEHGSKRISDPLLGQAGYTFEEIVQELCQMFGWQNPNVLAKLAGGIIARLQACYLKHSIEPDIALNQETWQEARKEGITFCAAQLREILQTDMGPEGMDARSQQIHQRFLEQVGPMMDAPVETVPRRRLEWGDLLKLEMALWKQLKEALQACAIILKIMSSLLKAAPNRSSAGQQPNQPLVVPAQKKQSAWDEWQANRKKGKK